MSVTLSNINTAVDTFNDIPDITFDSIDVTAYTEEVEIYTNTPAVMIPSKLNAMAASMKTWINTNVSAPLENQQNTFKNEVVVRTNTAMNAVETYMNDEVQGFVNTVFVPWANDSGAILSTHANLLEGNVTSTMAQLQLDYTAHVVSQDAIIAQALADMLANLGQYTSGAADSGYTIHQTNELMADITMTRQIAFSDYLYDVNDAVLFAHEGPNITHHINYAPLTGTILSFGESMQVTGEPRPFIQHLRMEISPEDTPSIEKIKAYDIFKNTTAGNVNSFRATGHEADGTPAEELTILNNNSVADVDNPELIIRRGTESALIWGGIDDGDFVKLIKIDGTTIYNDGVINNYAQDYDTTLFKPHQSYCHDSSSAVTGWGVLASHNASDVDSSGGLYDTPTKCETYTDSVVSLLDDFSRTYEYDIAGESYDGSISDGLIYKVYINDDAGIGDGYAYTIDANGKTGTGAILTPQYDDGVSDVVVTAGGSKYSVNASARLIDLGPVDQTGSIETKAVATHTLKDGMIQSIVVEAPGVGYTGYWEVSVDAVVGGDAHVHKVHLTQTEVNTIKAGGQIITITVDPGHTHNQTITWNSFNESFQFTATDGIHNHPLGVTTHTVNPTITATITSSTGGLATSEVYLKEDDTLDFVKIINGGADYVETDSVTITGGTPSVVGAASFTLANGGIAGFAVSLAGTGYTPSAPKIVSVNIQNSQYSPKSITANVGDTIEFTNLDIQPHSVTHADGMFDSGDIPQNAVYSYVITKPTRTTEKYDIYDTHNINGTTATLWVRDSTTYIEMISATGGGAYGFATVSGAGPGLTNIAVVDPGYGYIVEDTVKIIDTSGPGEGSYASSVITDRSIGVVSITNGGMNYSIDSKIVVIDPTGFPVLDGTGTEIGRTYGSGAILKPIFQQTYVAGYCSDVALIGETACNTGFGTWTPEVVVGQLTAVNVFKQGSGYNDVEFIINDPNSTGSGCVLAADLNNVITSIPITSRGVDYTEPHIIVSDAGGLLGTSNQTIGTGFVGSVVLNNGIGAVTIVSGWQDYVPGETRVIIIDDHAEPTGFGAVGEATTGINGNIEVITITNPGSAYKTPLVLVAGPVLYPGAYINNVATDLAIYGPEANSTTSPFADNNQINSNVKNGVMIQFENSNGHTLNDSWSFKLQSWMLGTPASILYSSSRYDGNLESMRGIITLKDMWEV
jgi:plastocyanin